MGGVPDGFTPETEENDIVTDATEAPSAEVAEEVTTSEGEAPAAEEEAPKEAEEAVEETVEEVVEEDAASTEEEPSAE